MKARPAAPALALVFACAASASAQTERERFAVSLGGGSFGGHALGASSASFTENRAPSGGRITYFDASSELERATLLLARASWRAWKSLRLEGGAAYGSRGMSTSLSNDYEGAAPLVSTGELSELQLEGGLRFDVTSLSFLRSRGVPFLFAAAAHVRQEPEAASSAGRTGQAYSAGLGVAYRVLKNAGLRLDAGMAWRSGGFEQGGQSRSAARVTLAVYAAR